MNEPLVSVGVPAFNGEPYVEETLDCILGQTYSNLEILISDNASCDRTGEICRRFAETDPRVRYRRNERNLGAAANYNQVFRMASGKYFKWAAVDDLLSSDFIERCVEVLETRDDAVLCYPKTTIIDEEGRKLKFRIWTK